MVVVCAFEGGNGIRKFRGDGDIHPPSPKYHSQVHCHLNDTEPLSGSGAAAGNAGGTAVVGTGGY